MTRPASRVAGALLLLFGVAAFAAVQGNAAQPGEMMVKAPGVAAPVPPRAAPQAPSPTLAALTAAIAEVTARRRAGSYAQWLDTLPDFRFSPATSALLLKQLGTDKLFSVQRQGAPDGRHDYLFTAPALRRAGPDGSVVAWEPIQGTLQLAADGRNARNAFSVPHLTVEDKTARFALRDLDATVSSADIESPYGDMAADIGSLQMLVRQSGSAVAMDGLFSRLSLLERADSASMQLETGMRTLTARGERFDDLHLAMRVSGIDKAALEQSHRLGKQLQQQQDKLGGSATPAQRSALMMPMLRQLGMALTAKGAVIDLDDLSFAYHGHTARVRGQVRLENGAPAGLNQLAMLFKKAVIHADISVPVAMVRAFTDSLARKQLAAQQPGADADAASIARLGGTIFDGMVNAAVTRGFLRIEGDMLITSIDVRDGVVLINGKPLPLPAQGAPLAALGRGPGGSAGNMRARLINEKCKLPDFPADAAQGDAAPSLALQLTVNADGSIANLALARSSGLPAYDQAVLAAAAHCTYIPALRNGQPVAVSERWEVLRPLAVSAPDR